MTKEETINHLKDILAEATETEHAVCYVTNEDAEALEMAIEELKQPERKTGKWIRHPIYEGSDHYYYACSECDYRSWTHDNYCSVCGARMEVQNE